MKGRRGSIPKKIVISTDNKKNSRHSEERLLHKAIYDNSAHFEPKSALFPLDTGGHNLNNFV